jgi:amino acid adenylation domain-containing protein
MSSVEAPRHARSEPREAGDARCRLRLTVVGPLHAIDWQARLPHAIAVDVRRADDDASQEIRLEADAARFDVRSLYLAFREAVGGPSAAPLAYEDYRRWRQGVLADAEWADERTRWREQERLDDSGERGPGLPDERTSDGQDRPDTIEQLVPESFAAAARDLCASRGWDEATPWLAAWLVMLARRTRQHELLIGLGLDGRNYEPLQNAIGPYSQWVPFRGGVVEHARIEELMDAIGADYRHAWQTQEHYGATADTTCRAWPFGFEHRAWPARARAGQIDYDVRASSHSAAAARKVRLSIEQTPAGTRVSIDYDATLYDRGSIARLLDGWLLVVEHVLRHPAQRVCAIDHRSVAERQRWSAMNGVRARMAPRVETVHAWIEQLASARPEQMSVGAHGRTLTYRQLNARANRLARYLIANVPVDRESRIGLCLPRGPELVTAMLAVWKAGAAYVPLDDEWPAARMASLLARTGASGVIVDRHTANALATSGVPIVDVDADAESIEAHADDDLGLATAGEQLAYVLFTSGSTGEPKGVAVEHRQLVHYAQALLDRLGLDRPFTFASLTTAAADLGNTAILGTLCSGGRLEWIDRQTAADGAALEAYCYAHPIDASKMTPSHVRSLLSSLDGHPTVMPVGRSSDARDALAPGDARGDIGRPAWLPAHTLVLGGEAFGSDLIAQLRALAPDLRIVNHYGPTETTIGVLTQNVTAADDVALGRPLGSAQTWICHAGGGIAGIGETGELWIGGPCVSRGYSNDPALTADRFRPDPHGGESGARLYRTGDLARLREDGTIEYLGRADQQVKIRGYRVEPEEVAAAVRGLRGIRQAAVVARREADDDVKLVAYVVGSRETREQEWRAELEQVLPAHLLPTHWVRMERLPLMPNGKLDRAALPEPGATGGSGLATDDLTPTEEMVAAIWAQVLQVPVSSRDDHFFFLGGHSLLANRAVARLRAAFGVAIPLRRLFEEPTVRAFAASVDRLVQAKAHLAPMPLERRTDAIAPLSFAQQRLWFLEQLEPGRAVYHVPLAVRARGPLDVDALERALTEIVRRHEGLRTVFVETTMTTGEPQQQVMAPSPVRLASIDLGSIHDDDAREAEARRIATREARQPFDLQRGPLWRATLVRLAGDEHVILLTLHHIICDGWSMGVLIRELGALYAAYRAGRSSPLPEPAFQYVDYARWQRAWLQGAVLDAQMAYWRTHLAGAPPMLKLPTDRPRPRVQSFRGGRVTRTWAAPLATGVRELSRREGVTLFMTLLAGFQALLARYTGERDICVGTPIANRTRVEVEGLIGFVINTLVLRTDLSGDPTFRELLRRVRQVALGAYAHQDLPFERLVDELQPERALSRNPLFQVMFVFQNGREQPLQLPGLTLSPVMPESTTSKFDLTVTVTPQPESFAMTAEYSADLFDASTIERLLDHLEMLLQSAVDAPDSCLATLLGDAEIASLLVDSNASTTATELRAFVVGVDPSSPDASSVGVPLIDASLVDRSFTDTETRLAGLWHETLGVAPTLASEFFAEGGHSLMAAAFVLHVQEAFDIDLPLRSLFEDPLFPRFAARIDRALRGKAPLPIAFDDAIASAAIHGSRPSASALVLLCEGEEPPLYLVHPISGSVTSYRALTTDRPDRRIYGIQCPALFGGGEPPETIEEMAAQYVAEISAFDPAGPCYIGGWSSGGLIAYEMARQMTVLGRNVRSLILIDTLAPEPRAADSDDALLAHLSGDAWSRGDAAGEVQSLDDKLAALLIVLRERGVAPVGFSLAWLRRAYLVYRANHRAKSAYVGSPYAGLVHLIRARESIADGQLDGGWDDLVTGALHTHIAPGAHHTLFTGDAVALRDLLIHLTR